LQRARKEAQQADVYRGDSCAERGSGEDVERDMLARGEGRI
jgi:hypothetical protein